MKFKLLLLGLLLLAVPVLAQDNTVSFNGFSFSLPAALATNVNITQFAGDPLTLEQPGGPDVKHVQFNLYSAAPAPESFFDAPVGIRLYQTADFTGYDQPKQVLTQLQTLLAQKPDLAQYAVADTNGQHTLPFLPVMPAAQVIRAQIHYLDTTAVHGISYVTIYRQDVSPFTSGDFFYTFQGLSADGTAYVTVVAHLNTDLFPATDSTNFTDGTQYNTYMAQSLAKLTNATATNFSPALTTLDGLVQTFSFGGAPVVPPPMVPTFTPTPSSMGGLAGTNWTLVSYGSADNPQTVLDGAPITIQFSEGGVTGSTGCNSYHGAFQFDNGAISFTPLATTLKACDQPIMDQEKAFLDAMTTTTNYTLNGNQLTITYKDGVLTFQAS